MADEKMIQAKNVFDTLCKTLDANDWHYVKDEEKLKIECGASGEDLPMKLHISVDAKRSVLMLLSLIPFSVPEDKRLDVAIAVSVVNNNLVDGSFDYDVSDGSLFFRMTNSFLESSIGSELINYMVYCSCGTIDEYNDKFLMLAKGMISLEKFLEVVK